MDAKSLVQMKNPPSPPNDTMMIWVACIHFCSCDSVQKVGKGPNLPDGLSRRDQGGTCKNI